MINCDIIKDLIPLVNDNVASEGSIELVTEHCKICSECASIINRQDLNNTNDLKILKKIKRNISYLKLIFTGLGILITIIFFSLNSVIFLNLLVIPLFSALPIILNKKRWLFLPGAIIIWSVLCNIYDYYFNYSDLYRPSIDNLFHEILSYFGIYSVLFVLGLLAGFLLKFAFGRTTK